MSELFESKAYPSHPTMPSQMPAGFLTPQTPSSGPGEPPLNEQEAEARRGQFYELLLRQVVEAIVGVFTGGSDAFSQLAQWAIGLAADIGGLIDSIVAGLSNWFLVGDILEVISGKEDGDTTDLGTVVNGWISDIKQTVDNIVGALFGWLGSGWSHEDAKQALEDQRAAVALLSVAAQALVNDKNNQAVGGVSAVFDFSDQPDQSSLPGSFTVTYSGSGTSTWIVNDGRTDVSIAYNDDRDAVARYNALATTTNYQAVGAAFASAPEWNSTSSFRSYNYLYARMNSAGTDYVYAEFGKYTIELGCVVGGVKTVFDTLNIGFSFKANSVYWLEAGTVGGERIFRVLEGTNPLITHTEVGTTSQLDASHRYAGMGIHVDTTPFNARRPGRVAAWAVADNQPPTVVGSGSTMIRTNTGSVNAPIGANLFTTNFFDTPLENTADIVQDRSLGKFTVSIAGWYAIDAHIGLNNATIEGMTLALYKNGSMFRHFGSEVLHGDSGNVPEGMGGSINVYLDEGDYVQLGYHSYALSATAGAFTGDAAGIETYFTICLANRSLA